MSLILEALRKSEAERQRGRAPGLFVEQQGLRRERGSLPAWAFWAAGGVLLLVLLAWAWRESTRSDAGAAGGPAAPPSTAAPADLPATTATDAVVAAPDVTNPPGSMPGLEAAPDPALVAVAPPAAEPEPVATVDIAAGAMADTGPDAAPAPLPAAPSSDTPSSIVATAPTDAAATTPPASPAAAPPAPMPAPAATAAIPAPAEDALPRLADIPAGERAGLPALKLSMHVYSDDPARRFVIVDGQRLTEGAAPAPGVVVEQIRRDGAVLSLNGRRVLLGRP